jgi:CRP-like cAMP-binding protein
MQHITQRSTREKLISYLSLQAREAGGSSFDIPFNREELAEFLSVDRSAMSSELGRMRADGLLTFRKNYFTLEPVPKPHGFSTGSGVSQV